jgi:hypothetical protein
VRQIQEKAFAENKHFASLYCKSPAPAETYSNILQNSDKATIYVPRGCKYYYEVAEGWMEYADRIEEYDY